VVEIHRLGLYGSGIAGRPGQRDETEYGGSRESAGGVMNTLRRGREALEALRSIPLFSSVSDEDLLPIASLLIERRFPKHKTIVEEGLPGDYMYIISEGRVQVSKLSDDGREKILEFLDAGDFFGEMSLLDNAPRSASVRALVESRVLALSRSDFLTVLRRSPDLAMAVIQELTRRLRQVDEQASSLSFQRVKERTKGLLVRLARDDAAYHDRRVTPTLTHQQIADMIGTSRETVTRALKGLKEHGWLQQEGKKYLVPVEDE
jgi:CRP-like cAMP-binding protein